MAVRIARRALGYLATAAVAVAIYAHVRPRSQALVRASTVAQTPSPDWVERWYSAPVVTLTADDMLFQGVLIAKVDSLHGFRLYGLEDHLRQLYPDLHPQSPHARLRAAHSAACNTAQLERTDRRILCAGRFVVVELATDADRRALGQIINSVEHLGFSVVLTFVRPTSQPANAAVVVGS